MAYKFELPQETVKNLWRLREFCAEGAIAKQVRQAVKKYIQSKEAEIGCPISDVQRAREEEVSENQERHTLKEAKSLGLDL